MRIVYVDAGENIKKLLTKELITPLQQNSNFEIFLGTPSTKEEALQRVKDADGILLGRHLSNEIIEQCEKLKIISFVGYGVKNYLDIDFIRNQGITITNTPGYGDNAVAEHALTLLLSLTKNMVRNHTRLQKDIWNQVDNSLEVRGKTIGLVGIGSIGERMAELCKALGMNVICWTFHPNKQRSKRLGIRFVNLDELFSQSDFVSLHLPYTDQTKGMIGERELSKMKQGSLFINTARAELVETDVLIKYLSNGKIAGAGLDVFDEEPLPENDRLLKLDNVILSPHVAFNTPESVKNMLKIAINNIVQFMKGTPTNIV